MKVTINLPKETMLRLAMDAHEEGVTLEALLQKMLYRCTKPMVIHSMEMNDDDDTSGTTQNQVSDIPRPTRGKDDEKMADTDSNSTVSADYGLRRL